MYEKCYFCLDQLPKLKKESTASFFVNFGRSRGTQEPTYITVPCFNTSLLQVFLSSLGKDDLRSIELRRYTFLEKSDALHTS